MRIAKSRGLQTADSYDLAQDVFVRIAKSVEKWDHDPEKGSFRGWIATIARNLTVDFLRKQNRQPVQASEGGMEKVSMIENEAAYFDAEYEKQLFFWAAEKIKPSFQEATWKAFWLSAVEHRAISDVAESLGVTPGAIYMARSRIIARLRRTIEAVESSDHSLRAKSLNEGVQR